MRAASTPAHWADAAAAAAAGSEVARAMYDRHGPPTGIRRTPPAERFASLAEAIAYQQLSGRAAATIWARVADRVGDPSDPRAVLDVDHDDLRSCGLSNAKALAVADLARRTLDGTLDLPRTSRMDDHEVISHLCQVRGVGPWTAQMYLIFDLGRLDVWPAGDLGVRNGWARHHGTDPLPEREFAAAADAHAPYRSVIAWWCWREVDTDVPGAPW